MTRSSMRCISLHPTPSSNRRPHPLFMGPLTQICVVPLADMVPTKEQGPAVLQEGGGLLTVQSIRGDIEESED